MTGELKTSPAKVAGVHDGYSLQQVLGNLIPGLVVVCKSRNLEIEFANESFCQAFGSNCSRLDELMDRPAAKSVFEAINKLSHQGDVQQVLTHLGNQPVELQIRQVSTESVLIQGTLKNHDGVGVDSVIKPVVETDNGVDRDQLIGELTSYKQMVQEKEDFLGQGSFEFNMVTGAQQMSRGFLSVFGLEANHPPITLYDLLRQYFDAGEQHRILEFFKYISETGEGREIEVTSMPNGGQKDLEIFAKVHRNPDGKTERIVGTMKDITAIKTLYNQLLQFKNELTKREFLLKHGTWEYDIRLGEYKNSLGLYHVFGADPEDQKRAFRMEDYYMPGEQEKADQLMHEVLQVGTAYVDDLMVRTPSGEIKYVEIFARLVRDSNGEPEGIYGITRDMTLVHSFKNELKDQLKQVDMMNQELTEAKKKLEIQLEELEKANIELQLYKQTMLDKDEFLNQGTWEWDIQANRMNYSRGIYRLFGYHHRDEMKEWDESGKDIFRHMDDDERKRSDDDWEKILEEADTYLREMEIITKDGFLRRLETFGKVFRDDQGKAYKVIGTTRDITKLKEYEQELEVKIDELNRSNRDLEEFAYIASHDLHEPLRKLSTFGQRLSVGAENELSPANRDYLERMLKATENMRNLIDNLLEFSRVTRGAATFVKTDLNKLVEEVISEQELKIEETGATVTAEKMPVVEVVPSQLKQVFNNLLNNALKFIQPPLKPEIRFECADLTPAERLRYKLKLNREYFKISVRDNGIGFDKAYADKIFQIFQRLHGKSEYSGSGIGLAICRKIADNHKGLIFAESEVGKGSVFTLILPNKP